MHEDSTTVETECAAPAQNDHDFEAALEKKEEGNALYNKASYSEAVCKYIDALLKIRGHKEIFKISSKDKAIAHHMEKRLAQIGDEEEKDTTSGSKKRICKCEKTPSVNKRRRVDDNASAEAAHESMDSHQHQPEEDEEDEVEEEADCYMPPTSQQMIAQVQALIRNLKQRGHLAQARIPCPVERSLSQEEQEKEEHTTRVKRLKIVCLLNIAACAVKMQDGIKAIQCCQRVMSMKGVQNLYRDLYIKCLYRQGQALRVL